MLLCVSEKGMGKRTAVGEYKLQARGGKGILTYRITEKTGNLSGIKTVTEDDDIMLITSDGTIIRMNVADIPVVGRATQGVILMRLQEGEKVVSVASLPKEEEDDKNEPADENNPENEEN
jgi:DNA gyrase subunit A